MKEYDELINQLAQATDSNAITWELSSGRFYDGKVDAPYGITRAFSTTYEGQNFVLIEKRVLVYDNDYDESVERLIVNLCLFDPGNNLMSELTNNDFSYGYLSILVKKVTDQVSKLAIQKFLKKK